MTQISLGLVLELGGGCIQHLLMFTEIVFQVGDALLCPVNTLDRSAR